MKKGLLKALCITALVAVTGVGGLALGAEISNGFETSYSEEAYTNHGDEQLQIGFDQGKEEGLEIGFENGYTAGEDAGYNQGKNDGLEEGYKNGQQAGYENGYNAGQNVGYENGYNAGESAGYNNGFEAGKTYRDPEKTYLEDIINGVDLNVLKIDNELTFLSGNNFALYGIYKLNKDNSVEQVYSEGIRWDLFFKLSSGSVIITSGNYSSGILFYNINSNTVTQIYETGLYWSTFLELSSGNVLISGSSISEDCILIFNPTTFQIDVFYNEAMPYLFELSNGNILMTDTEKFILFNSTTNEFKQIYTTTNVWNIFYEMSSGDVLISGTGINGQEGLLLYDSSTNEISRIYDRSFSLKYFYELSNGNVLISGDASFELLLYDVITNEVAEVYSSGRVWDTFVPDENGVTISSSTYPDQGSVYYDYATGSVTPVEEVA